MNYPQIPDPRIRVTPTGIEFRDDLSFDEWDDLGTKLAPLGRSIGFVLGDWLNYGQRAFGEKYTEAIARTGISYQTLANFAYVARSVDFSCRQEKLGFEHHAVVAKLRSTDDQKYWLEMANRHSLSVRRLRKSINYGRLATEEEMQENPADRRHVTYLLLINNLIRWWKRETEKAPVDTWDRERREGLKKHFAPVAEIHNAL